MAFITVGSAPNTQVISFAEYQDVLDMDQRVFEANEGQTEVIVEDQLIRSTERILSLFRATAWWRTYFLRRDTTVDISTMADIPELNPNRIQARKKDFQDLCVYYALYNYILPKIADFSAEDNAERVKIGFYQQKYDLLFGELISAGDWYDFGGDGVIVSADKQPGYFNLKRIR